MAGRGARAAGGRRHLVLALSVLLACSGVVACDAGAPPTPPREVVSWPPGPWEPARSPYVTSQKERALIDLPWAGHPGLDLEPARPVRRLIVNVERGGALYFKGMRWSLDPERSARAFQALAVEVRMLAKRDGSGKLPLMSLRVDYRRPFEDVRGVLAALRAPPAAIAGLHLAVASPAPDAWRESRIELTPITDPIEASAKVGITLGWPQGPDDASAVPFLRIGDDRFAFAAGDPYAAGAANDLANRNWRAIAARLERAKAGGGRVAMLTIDDPVPWAYVAMTVGTSLDAGIDCVHLAETGYRVSTPAARSLPWHAGDRDPRDWHPAVALGVGACIALAVFGLGAWTRRSLRHGVPRSRGAGATEGAARPRR